jgi:molybdopterin converting factor small subunit
MTEELSEQSRSIKVKVSYLGFIRDMTGKKEDNFDLHKPVYIRDVVVMAAESYPRVLKIRELLRISINGAMTTENLELQDGDILSLMAPIVGG